MLCAILDCLQSQHRSAVSKLANADFSIFSKNLIKVPSWNSILAILILAMGKRFNFLIFFLKKYVNTKRANLAALQHALFALIAIFLVMKTQRDWKHCPKSMLTKQKIEVFKKSSSKSRALGECNANAVDLKSLVAPACNLALTRA